MPDVREKLVELLDEVHHKPLGKEYQERLGAIADHLIANGVIFETDRNVGSKWIPVTERLPEDDISSARYLCYANGYVRILKYWRMYKSFEYGGKPIKVTHWMPLPEAPKGDD